MRNLVYRSTYYLSLTYFISRENDISVVRSKELAVLVQAGDIDSLSFMVSKWHLKYNNIRVENTPLLHLAVISDQFHMVKYLLAQGIDVEALDQVSFSYFTQPKYYIVSATY